MDGFVNDVDASRRRGLHARDPDEMVAWDSVVGHHMGLAHAHASFTKTFKKTSTDEVRELYRHGIVHGMLVNYDNEYVGAKAWNRLCAVRDWATSMRKAAEPPKPQPSLIETMRKIDLNRHIWQSTMRTATRCCGLRPARDIVPRVPLIAVDERRTISQWRHPGASLRASGA